MDKIQEQLKKNTAILDPYASMVPAFVDLSAKAGVNPGLVLGGIGAVGILVLLILQGWTILVTVITVLYPALHSIRAIESPDADDDKIWLTYWMVFGVFNVAETFFGFIFWFIPYWGWIRCAGFIWLLLPNFKGSEVVYKSVLKPLLKANKDLIEHYMNKATTAVASAGDQVKAAGTSAVADAMKDPSVIAGATQAFAQAQTMANEAKSEEPVEADNRD